jgi:hypothetical protein
VLLTRAQLESEEHHTEAALRTVDEALQLGRKSRDPALLFMATKAQATTALAATDIRLAIANGWSAPKRWSTRSPPRRGTPRGPARRWSRELR